MRKFLTLRYEIERRNWQLQEIGAKLYLSPSQFSRRMCGQTPWTVDEALHLMRLLDIPIDQIGELFAESCED